MYGLDISDNKSFCQSCLLCGHYWLAKTTEPSWINCKNAQVALALPMLILGILTLYNVSGIVLCHDRGLKYAQLFYKEIPSSQVLVWGHMTLTYDLPSRAIHRTTLSDKVQ